jgi:hypothetical protein
LQAHDEEKKQETASDDFLGALRFQYEKELELRNSLDSKANNMLTVCGSIITIAIAIATFLVSRIFPSIFVIIGLIALGAGIFCAAQAMSSFIKSYSLRSYRFAMGDEVFFDKKTGEYNKEQTMQFLNTKKEVFAGHMAKEYLESIRQNKTRNQEKGDMIKNGQKSLRLSILVIAGLVIYSVIVITLQSAIGL